MTNLETPVHQEILFIDDFQHQNANVISSLSNFIK
jgi:hypothetical protein